MRRDRLGDQKITQDVFLKEGETGRDAEGGTESGVESLANIPHNMDSQDPFAETVSEDTEPFEYVPPVRKGMFGGIGDKVFGVMSGGVKDKLNRKYPEKRMERKEVEEAMRSHEEARAYVPSHPLPPTSYPREHIIGALRGKTLAERVRDSLRFPPITKSGTFIASLALIAFCTGTYLIYSEIPTHPELVAGMVLVSLSSSILIGR